MKYYIVLLVLLNFNSIFGQNLTNLDRRITPYFRYEQSSFDLLQDLTNDSLTRIVYEANHSIYLESVFLSSGIKIDSTDYYNELYKALCCFNILEYRNALNRKNLYGIGVVYSGLESYEVAKKYFTQGLDFRHDSLSKPSIYDLHEERAYCKYNLKDYFGAIDDYSFALNEPIKLHKVGNFQLASNDKENVYYHRALCYMLISNPTKAQVDLNKVIELNKKNADAYFYRGLIYITILKDKPKGCSDLSKASDYGHPKALNEIHKLCE